MPFVKSVRFSATVVRVAFLAGEHKDLLCRGEGDILTVVVICGTELRLERRRLDVGGLATSRDE